MNRLWVRLTLAFVAVTLVGVGTVALLAGVTTGQQLRQYLNRQAMLAESGRVDELAAYYQRTGSWEGVGALIASFSSTGLGPGAGGGAGRGRGSMMGNRPYLLLADANGLVIYDESGMGMQRTLTSDDKNSALPISVQGKTVGYLLVTAAGQGMMDPAEQSLLDQLRNTLLIAALAAGAVGILFGVVISRTLAAPLASLSAAARGFAAHQWDRRAPVGGTVETAEAAQAFNEMAAALQQAESQRRNMMADIAHELRTPLTVMQGNLQAMLDGVYPMERGEIATIYDQTRLLNRLVDDVRELALAEAGQLRLNLAPVDLRRLIESISGTMSGAAEERKVKLALVLPAELPVVRGDPDRLNQILINLLSNALRHTPEGGAITVTAEGLAGKVRVSVSDTGEGISAEDLPHVFDRFYRGDRSRARSRGGTGLGLAIAKAWVQAMQGEIGVESALDRGAHFWFALPQALTPAA